MVPFLPHISRVSVLHTYVCFDEFFSPVKSHIKMTEIIYTTTTYICRLFLATDKIFFKMGKKVFQYLHIFIHNACILKIDTRLGPKPGARPGLRLGLRPGIRPGLRPDSKARHKAGHKVYILGTQFDHKMTLKAFLCIWLRIFNIEVWEVLRVTHLTSRPSSSSLSTQRIWVCVHMHNGLDYQK